MQQTEDKQNTCPECGTRWLEERMQTVCPKCGLVKDAQPMVLETRNAVFPDEQRERWHYAVLHDKTSPATQLGFRQETNLRLQKIQNIYAQPPRAREMRTIMAEVNKIAGKMELSYDIQAEIVKLINTYKMKLKRKFMGKQIVVVVAACAWWVIRARGNSQAIPQFAQYMNILATRLRKEIILVRRHVHVSTPNTRANLPFQLCEQIHRVDLLPEVHRLLKSIRFPTGKNPRGIVIAAIYVASLNCTGKRITQKEAAEVSGVTEVTVRTQSRLFRGK